MVIKYIHNSIKIELPIEEKFSNATLKIYLYNFKEGAYTLQQEQTISFGHEFTDCNQYTFKYPISSKTKIKCVVEKNAVILDEETFYSGSKHNITITKKRVLNEKKNPIDIYELYSEIPLSRSTIYYKIPNSDVRIFIPEDLKPEASSVFMIKDDSFMPKFECISTVAECLQLIQ